MVSMVHYLYSIIMTLMVCFLLPLSGISALLGVLTVGQWIPAIAVANGFQVAWAGAMQFLATFGNGHPWQGLVVICLTISMVGGLFDLFALYKYQQFGDGKSV
jgi:hypothetical protein